MKCADIADLHVLEALEARTFAVLSTPRDWEQPRGEQPRQREAPMADVALQERYPDAPYKVIHRKLEIVYRRGWLDYGVSIRTGWITDKGRAHLEKLRAGTLRVEVLEPLGMDGPGPAAQYLTLDEVRQRWPEK